MKLSRTLALALWMVGGLLATLPAQVAVAQENPQYAAAKAKARQAFSEGRYEDAALLFREAFDAEPRSTLLYNIGLCYEKSGNVQSAIVFYERFVQAAPESAKRPAVSRKVAELKTQIGDKYVEVSVETMPPDAVIFVDDKSKGAMGTSPLTFKLLPGSYTIIAEKSGHEPAKQSVRLDAGRPGRVAMRLVSTDRVGAVQLFISETGAQISVDGRPVGRAPLPEALRLPAGQHELTVMKPGFAPYKTLIQVAAGEEKRVTVDLSGESGGGDIASASSGGGGGGGGGKIWPWVVMGVGVAAVGGGVVTGLSAQNLHDQLTEKRNNRQPIAPQDIDTGNQFVMLTNVLIGAGSALVVGGVAWWLFDGGPLDRGGSTSLGFGPTADGNGSMVQLGGTF